MDENATSKKKLRMDESATSKKIMDESESESERPPKKKRTGWRAEVSDESRQSHLFSMARAIRAASGPNDSFTFALNEARRIEWELFNYSATSPPDYQKRVSCFLRSLRSVTQGPGESSTAEIREQEVQHVASSSSDAAPAMAGNPSDWRVAVSQDARSSYRFKMVSAICKNSDTKMMIANEAAIQVEEELFNAATSVLDYQTRVGSFLSSRPAVTQGAGESWTPEIRYLGRQHGAESSSGAMGDVEEIEALRKAFERYEGAAAAMEEDFIPFDLSLQSAFENSKRDTDVMLTAVDELREAMVGGAKKAKRLSSLLRSRMRESGIVEETTVTEAIWQQMKAIKKNQNIVLALQAQPTKDTSAGTAASSVAGGAEDSAAADVRAMPPPKIMHDCQTRVDNFQRSRPAVTQGPSESSTPQIMDLMPQHVAESSSSAAPAAPVDSKNQAGQRNPEQQPDGERLNVDLSSASVDTTLQSGPSEQQNPSGRQSNVDCNIVPVDTTLRMGPSEQQNLSGRQSDADCNPGGVDVSLRLEYDALAGILSLKSHLSGRESDSDRSNVASSMPPISMALPPQQVQVPQQQVQLPPVFYLPPPSSEWQRSNLAFVGRWRWPAVPLGPLVHVQNPLLPRSRRQRLEWWGTVLPLTELPPQWLQALSQVILPAGFVWGIHFPTNPWYPPWLVVALLPQQPWPQLLNILSTDPHSLRSHVVVIFPPSELPPPPQLQAPTSSGKRKAPEQY